jgi:hypothetical protein
MVLGIGYWIYRAELVARPDGTSAIVDQADVAGVKSDLISIGEAERLYLTAHEGYATLDQLQEAGSIPFRSRHGYNFSIEVDGAQHFRAVATPATASKTGWPALSIDETLQINQP